MLLSREQRRRATLEGVHAARRLHAKLASRQAVEAGDASQVDVFGAAVELGAELLFRPLEGILGAYISQPVAPVPGIIISTQRSLKVQRFTAAHELGHLTMNHSPSVDSEVGLWRGESRDTQELAADAFASEFLLPKWLFIFHARRHGWKSADFHDPAIAYQLSLRLGASYDATCWGLQGHKILPSHVVRKLRSVKPKDIKLAILGAVAELPSPWADVWVVGKSDDGLHCEGSPDDVVLFESREHVSSGYLWDEEAFERRSLEILSDWREGVAKADELGGEALRRIAAKAREPGDHDIELLERRPWSPSDHIGRVSLKLRLHGKEQGLPRSVRKRFGLAS